MSKTKEQKNIIDVTADTNGTYVQTPKSLNEELVAKGLWRKGCQFLSKEEKLTLMTTKSKAKKEELYKKASDVIKKVAQSAVGRNYEDYRYKFSEKNTTNGVHVFGNIEQLQKFMTPVQEQPVYFSNGTDMIPAPKHKAIVNVNDGKIVSVMNNSYKLTRNEDVIMPLLEALDKYDSKWYIDQSHSFITPSKVRMQITFPDLTFKDGESEIAMSMFLTNSYDGSTSLNMKWGAIRSICTNGMVFGKIMADFYHRHSSYFVPDELVKTIEDTYKQIPVISERVRLLEQKEFALTDDIITQVNNTIGKRAMAYVNQEHESNPIQTQYQMMNILTYYISHYVNYKSRAQYQHRVSEMFEL